MEITLAVAQVARILQVSGPTVYGMVRAGEMPTIRVGRQYRIPARSFERWVKNRELQP
ncbi:MAG: helix-turn-helix domain-containing protein [Chloroflexota bacterium]